MAVERSRALIGAPREAQSLPSSAEIQASAAAWAWQQWGAQQTNVTATLLTNRAQAPADREHHTCIDRPRSIYIISIKCILNCTLKPVSSGHKRATIRPPRYNKAPGIIMAVGLPFYPSSLLVLTFPTSFKYLWICERLPISVRCFVCREKAKRSSSSCCPQLARGESVSCLCFPGFTRAMLE